MLLKMELCTFLSLFCFLRNGEVSSCTKQTPKSFHFRLSVSILMRASIHAKILLRYVDTFNKGGGSPANLFQSPSVPVVKPTGNAGTPKFFIPSTVAAPSEQQQMEPIAESRQEEPVMNEAPSTSAAYDPIPSSSAPSQITSMQRFPSMGNIPRRASMVEADSSFQSNSRRTASWSGSFNDSFSPPLKNAEIKTLGEQLGIGPSSFLPSDHPPLIQMPMNGGGSFDELQEVEL